MGCTGVPLGPGADAAIWEEGGIPVGGIGGWFPLSKPGIVIGSGIAGGPAAAKGFPLPLPRPVRLWGQEHHRPRVPCLFPCLSPVALGATCGAGWRVAPLSGVSTGRRPSRAGRPGPGLRLRQGLTAVPRGKILAVWGSVYPQLVLSFTCC